MKRLWIGAALLAVMLVSGLWVTKAMQDIQEPVAKDLEEAAHLALEDEWGKAEALTTRARKQWQKKWHMTAAVADHEPMDEIDALFAELEVYAKSADSVSYSGTCAHLAELLKAMSEAHGLNWWNLL